MMRGWSYGFIEHKRWKIVKTRRRRRWQINKTWTSSIISITIAVYMLILFHLFMLPWLFYVIQMHKITLYFVPPSWFNHRVLLQQLIDQGNFQKHFILKLFPWETTMNNIQYKIGLYQIYLPISTTTNFTRLMFYWLITIISSVL